MHELIATAAVLVLLLAYSQIYIFIAAWEVSFKHNSTRTLPFALFLSFFLSSSLSFQPPPSRRVGERGFSRVDSASSDGNLLLLIEALPTRVTTFSVRNTFET